MRHALHLTPTPAASGSGCRPRPRLTAAFRAPP
jgi:hypothetical protein